MVPALVLPAVLKLVLLGVPVLPAVLLVLAVAFVPVVVAIVVLVVCGFQAD